MKKKIGNSIMKTNSNSLTKIMSTKKQKNKISEITISGLATMMQDGFKKQDDKMDTLFKKQDDKMDTLFKRQEKITDEKIDDLAGMVKRGFDATSKEIGGVRDDLIVVKNDLATVKEKVDNIEKFIFQQQNPRIQKVEKRLYHIEEVLMLNK